jgi:hypothetical protein
MTMMLVGWLVFIELAEVQDAFGLFCGGPGCKTIAVRKLVELRPV